MSLKFLFSDDVQRIFNNFHSLFGIRIAFFAPDGKELKVGNNINICRYCQSIRMCHQGAAACNAEDRSGRILANQRKKVVIYTCHGGMTEVIKPILQQGQLLGYAMIGQIRTQKLPPPKWCSKWNIKHAENLENIFSIQPLISQTKLMQIVDLFCDITDLLITRKMIDHTGIDIPIRVSAYIQEHIHDVLPLPVTATSMHVSESRLSHLIKEYYGISYSALVKNLKMEHARFLLTHYFDMTIGEIAAAVGYSDPQYFSRVFSKNSGISPSDYRKQQNYPQS